jgi:hypothetical protein
MAGRFDAGRRGRSSGRYVVLSLKALAYSLSVAVDILGVAAPTRLPQTLANHLSNPGRKMEGWKGGGLDIYQPASCGSPIGSLT